MNSSPVDRFLYPLIFASAVCLSLVVSRSAWAETVRFTGLLGNLLLAWIPFVFAMLLVRYENAVRGRGWYWAAGVIWFLFYPNAPYIVTDLVHVKKWGQDGIPRWFDLLLINAHAFTGMLLGWLALWLVHGVVARKLGRLAGHGFVLGMLFLSAFGIYLGRVLRLNSWDVVTRPFKLFNGLASLTDSMKAGEVVAFTLSFFLFQWSVYWVVARMLSPVVEVERVAES